MTRRHRGQIERPLRVTPARSSRSPSSPRASRMAFKWRAWRGRVGARTGVNNQPGEHGLGFEVGCRRRVLRREDALWRTLASRLPIVPALRETQYVLALVLSVDGSPRYRSPVLRQPPHRPLLGGGNSAKAHGCGRARMRRHPTFGAPGSLNSSRTTPFGEVLVGKESDDISVSKSLSSTGTESLVGNDDLVVAVDVVLVRALSPAPRRCVPRLIELLLVLRPKERPTLRSGSASCRPR